LIAVVAGGLPVEAADHVVVAQTDDIVLWAPMYVARRLGYFREEGVDLDVIAVKSGPETLAALNAGSAHVAMGFPATPINAITRGHKVKMFAALSNQFVTQLIIQGNAASRLGLTAATPVDERIRKLKGLKLATNGSGSAADYLLQNLVKSVGLKPDADISIVPVGDAQATLAAFQQKRIDGFIATPPSSNIAVQTLRGYQLIDFTSGEFKPVDGMLYVALTADEAWLNARPEVAGGMVRALAKALSLIRNNPGAAKAATRTYFTTMDPALFDAGWDGTVASFPASPRLSGEGVQGILAFMAVMSGKPILIDPQRLYTNRFVDIAERQN
jgi:NitT/TauT family transport system substrate-binding protein